jgi:endonuclease YncB( thermonuclease family)
MRRGSPRSVGSRAPRRLAALLVAALAATAAPAEERGPASATGSDSLTLNGHAYALFGIDGLGFNQSCLVDGQPFACGVAATRALQTLLAAAPVACTPNTEGEALCTGADGDIALALVTQGWAVADPAGAEAYGAAEAAARAAGAGAWAGQFLAPAAYHELIAATEARYAEAAAETVRAAAEAGLVAGTLDLRGLVAPAPTETTAGDLPPRALRLAAFGPGRIAAAVPAPGIFTWPAVAAALEAERQAAIATLAADLAAPVWQALAERPARTVATADAAAFYAALTAGAAAWRAAGRQPLLHVMAPDQPAWVRDWFAGQPPAGAVVTRRAERTSPAYLGTIDGIDVYLGAGSARAALLVPADLLAAVTYRRDAAGHVLALDAPATPGAWTLRYAAALGWRDDPVLWLAFPRRAAPTPDAG